MMAPVELPNADQESLFSFASSGAPGTTVTLSHDEKSDPFSAVRVRLLLAGFVDITQKSVGAVTARLPSYEKGASVVLPKDEPPVALAAWQSALQKDARAAGVALVDEQDLLEADGLSNAAAAAAASDDACEPKVAAGKRAPCKNCSCGLADELAATTGGGRDATTVPVPVVQGDAAAMRKKEGGCGSCALGDAFRCAGCPYLGMPPFKEGEKVALPASLMTSDI